MHTLLIQDSPTCTNVKGERSLSPVPSQCKDDSEALSQSAQQHCSCPLDSESYEVTNKLSVMFFYIQDSFSVSDLDLF